jgi:hypothetical protein
MNRGARLRHALLFAALVAIPGSALAADLGVEVSAAQITARSGSRNIRDLDAIHERMQAAINCLVGPTGADFVAAVRNPCAATGNGVIPDTPDQAKKARYMEAVAKLKAVLKMDDRQAAMEAALAAADFIVTVSEQ